MSLDHVLAYALRGWHVFPLKPNSNKPATQHGHKDATVEAEVITRWWQRNPQYNIGVFLKPSCLAVIDVDRHAGDGFDTLRDLEAKYGPLPATLTATTPRGGEHRYFRIPRWAKLPGNLGPEVDIKCDGYTVLPPSRRDELDRPDHEGKAARIVGDYAWIAADAEIADMPAWVLEWKSRPQAFVVKSEGGLRTDGRRRAAMSLAGAMRARGCDVQTIVSTLKADNEAQNAEPLADADLEAIANGYVERYAPHMTPTWQDNLLRTARGGIKRLLANALIALREAPAWRDVLRCDTFALQVHAVQPTPWGYKGVWNDAQDTLATDWLQREGIEVEKGTTHDAVKAVALEHGFHPVRDYLNGLSWDGRPRVDRLLCDYFIAPDGGRYTESVGRYWLISAVARIFQPGCQADHTLILEGPQGKRKSSALRALFEPWFSDDFSEVGSKDSKMEVAGKWCIELSELDAMSRRDAVTVKSFLTRRVDRFRAPYDRLISEHPRQCVFAASTNEAEYLRDATGGRRFWPVRVGIAKPLDVDALLRDKDQLWAEAVRLYRDNARWWIDAADAELLAAAESEQAARGQIDPWDELLADYMRREGRGYCLISEVLANAVPGARHTTADAQHAAAALRRLGYEPTRTRDRKYRYWRLPGVEVDGDAFEAVPQRF